MAVERSTFERTEKKRKGKIQRRIFFVLIGNTSRYFHFKGAANFRAK
jgi:hypothetical protein